MPSKYKNKKKSREIDLAFSINKASSVYGCISLKKGYDSEHEALKSIVLRKNPPVFALRAYKCNDCGQWHLTRSYT